MGFPMLRSGRLKLVDFAVQFTEPVFFFEAGGREPQWIGGSHECSGRSIGAF